jgi:transcriptional regulator with XRE-family HTH domain
MKKVIGKLIKEARTTQRLSQEDLAGLCDVDRSYISMIEVGRNEPSITKLFDLCFGLGLKPSEFMKKLEDELDAHKNKPSSN